MALVESQKPALCENWDGTTYWQDSALKVAAMKKLGEIKAIYPPESWPKLPKKKENLEEEDLTIGDAPRVLKLTKPARALPTLPPAPPVVFRKLVIAKPAPKSPPVTLKNAVFALTITANGKPKAPLILRKPTPPAQAPKGTAKPPLSTDGHP